MKKLLSILLSLVLLSCLCAAFAEEDVIDVSIVVYQRSNQGNADDIWWWDYCREQFGINFTVTQVTSASDYKSIAFASGDMPDMIYNGVSGNDLLLYTGTGPCRAACRRSGGQRRRSLPARRPSPLPAQTALPPRLRRPRC